MSLLPGLNPDMSALGPFSSTGRRPRWYRFLPLALVVGVLITLIVVSFVLGRRSDALRRQFVEVVSPANAALLRTQVALAGQLAAVRGYQITGESLYLARLKRARASEVAAAERLSSLKGRLGPEVDRALETLEERRNTWAEGPDELLAGKLDRGELSTTLVIGQQRFEAALIAADEAGAAVNRAESALVRGIGTAAWAERIMVILLSLAALPVVLLIAWLSRHLAESEARFRQIAENLRETVWISDPGLSTFYYVNPAFERLWRIPVVTLRQDAHALLASVHPEDRPAVEAALPMYARGDFRARFRIVRPDGEIRWIHARASAVRDEKGRTFRIVGTAEDITDAKAAEDDRELLLARERTAREETEAALRTRDRVLRIVSHDLKNPLHTIGMTTELLEMPLPPEKHAEQIGIIRRTVNRAQQLVYDLLDAARVQSDKPMPIDPRPVEVRPLIDEAIEAFALQAEQKKVRLEQSVSDEVTEVVADRTRLLQVLSNLIGNAVKFTQEGGLIAVGVTLPGDDRVEFRVTDTGTGIAPEVVPHIFEPFTQARDGATLGTGLGLSIAKGIVEAHGGEITVESAPGSGTTFCFTIPTQAA